MDIVIYGAGGLGREVLALLNSLNQTIKKWNFLGFIDDNLDIEGVIGDINYLKGQDIKLHLVIAIGNPVIKQKIYESIKHLEMLSFPSLIHPNALIMDSQSVSFGEGSIITAGSIFTTNITIGRQVLINLNSTVGHHVTIGDFSSVMPGVNIAGNVCMDKTVLAGSGSNILHGVHIGANARIGSGAVVTKDVLPATTVVGVPAKEV